MTTSATAPAALSPESGGPLVPPGAPSWRHLYAIEVRRALEARNVTQLALAKSVGISPRQVWYWVTARSLPYVESAQRASDALNWPALVEIARKARTFRCRTCSRRLVSETSNMSRRYCDEQCRRVGVKAGRNGTVPDARDAKIELLNAAVDAMCGACEPAGICGDGGCPLRNVSPLPLRRGLTVVTVPTDGRRSRWDDPREHEKASAKLREKWAGSTERRQKMAEVNRAKWAAMTPEQRAARGAAISAALRKAKAA